MGPDSDARRWPALVAAWYVTAFCAVAGGAVVWNMATGSPLRDNAVVVLALVLRGLTVLLALAAVQRWGRRLPDWTVLAGLCGAAAVQLLYPVAETVVKTLILTGLMDPIDKGISNMSGEGWFNFGATWLVWGVPGVLFALAARDFGRRRPVRAGWVAFGLVAGAALLAGLGAAIG
ncbi:hypothetical protein Daura_11385 [Dactylosporangium aurantiacum]|uniref:Uncharacterized protein n=1 Tax=Dactylosporangium aurantiacum TaxID=35754 RepID=A0A9Q9IIC5_9ACTN|nr:hypothetical protein [Dactylosporangium aurantiacum]MDG6104289.1 hypothetical protein [Dactylosporangium aurantiacum]UWZ56714.1 hypothetical protein Daura_11385 [Dactylosporangium aurantiacum]